MALLLLVSVAGGQAFAVELTYTPVATLGDVTDIRHAGDRSGRLFLVVKTGQVRVLRDGALQPEPWLDIADRLSTQGEQGLLSLAFAPDFATSGLFYVWYTDPDGDTVLARYSLSARDPERADPDSEQRLLVIGQPRGNHNGGRLEFGPDGYLYLSVGDGGGGGDPFGNGQNPETLLGAVLRLDVDPVHGTYAVPPDNPFVGRAGADEIWAWGLRNPWRIAFDRLTGDLFIADVGQNEREEVSVLGLLEPGGANLGWPILEGSICYGADSCDASGLRLPVSEYDHDGGNCSITGGEIYRGAAYPALNGVYLYGDFCSGRIWGLRRVDDRWRTELLDDTDYRIMTFGAGEDGSLYLADRNGGIYRLSDGAAVAEAPFSFNAGLNDAWSDPKLDGQGFMITVLPELRQVFLAWFTYDLVAPAPGTPARPGDASHRWLGALGPYQGGVARMGVELTAGGVFGREPPVAEGRDYGEIILTFTHCNQGMVTYRLPEAGVSGQIPIVRTAGDTDLCEVLAGRP